MTSSLVGSEMCIRDRGKSTSRSQLYQEKRIEELGEVSCEGSLSSVIRTCLLYTSDAADDM
eukprot:712145-Prorocentrum_lima.AAC.1